MASAGKYSLQGAFFPLSITVAASYFTKKWSIMTADILTSTCLNTLGLIQIQEPFKVFCHLVVSAALAPKVPPQNFYWEEVNFQHIIDRFWKSITQNSKLHTQKKIEQYEWTFQSKSESILQYIWESQFHRCQHFWFPPFSANLQTWCFIGGQEVQKQNCVDTTLQVNFKHLSAWAQISYGTLTKHQTWCKLIF